MNDYRPVAISANEEPLLSNRWALKLPDELKIEYYHVHSIGTMKYDIKKGRWNPVQIKIRDGRWRCAYQFCQDAGLLWAKEETSDVGVAVVGRCLRKGKRDVHRRV